MENKKIKKDKKQEDKKEIMLQLEKCTKERDEYLEGWKRAKADLINYKKEEAKRLELFVKFSNENLVRELLLIIDSMDMGLKNLKKNSEERKGVSIIKNQFENVLKNFGLKKISVSRGDKFDPKIHEAISKIHSDAPPGTIVNEIQAGYFFHDKVIRPAQVAVSEEKGHK